MSELEYMPPRSPVNRGTPQAEARFEAAIEAFDALNAADPNTLEDGGALRPKELVQAERLSRWVLEVDPDASEALRLAARCQHLRRWEIPRSRYPEGRTGYLTWRKDLARFHADRAEAVLRSVGYDDDMIDRVRRINLKRSLKLDADTQTMEDALCLSFLEHELVDFSSKHADEKVVDILRKTWRKMSARGRELGTTIALDPRTTALVEAALAAEAASPDDGPRPPGSPDGEPSPSSSRS